MKITEKTVYVIDGKQFDSLEKAKSFEEDVIGAFVEANILNTMGLCTRERLRIVEKIIEHRDTLLHLLSLHDLTTGD
jgi:hypothetical protein